MKGKMPKRNSNNLGEVVPKRVRGNGQSVAAQAVNHFVALVTESVLEALSQRERVVERTDLRSRIRCHRCLMRGHKVRDCRNDVRCFRCGGWGHVVSRCATPAPDGEEQASDKGEKSESEPIDVASCPRYTRSPRPDSENDEPLESTRL